MTINTASSDVLTPVESSLSTSATTTSKQAPSPSIAETPHQHIVEVDSIANRAKRRHTSSSAVESQQQLNASHHATHIVSNPSTPQKAPSTRKSSGKKKGTVVATKRQADGFEVGDFEQDPVEYAITCDMTRSYKDDGDELSEHFDDDVAKLFKDQMFMKGEYMRNVFPVRTSVGHHLTFQKWDNITFERIFRDHHLKDRILLYIKWAASENADEFDSGEALLNGQSGDLLRQAVTVDRTTNKLYWVMRNIINTLIAAGGFPSHVHPCGGTGTLDSVIVLLNLPGCEAQRFHYDYLKDLYCPVDDDPSKINQCMAYHGNSLMFNYTDNTMKLDIRYSHKTHQRESRDILPMSLFIFTGNFRHAGPANNSNRITRKLFVYGDKCPGCRKTHRYQGLVNGKVVWISDNAIYDVKGSDEEEDDCDELD